MRRCRPLLGTFVEIAIQDQDERKLLSAIDSGFRAVERVQSLMSAHDPESDLSRLNQHGFRGPVKMNDETFEVIHRGIRLAEQSKGAFDITVGATLARWGFLPKNLQRRNHSDWRSVKLLSQNRIRFLRPLTIDLGGIAKGYAVDCAVQAIQQCGVQSGIVNAGGDLRVFGSEIVKTHLRHPQNPYQFINPIQMCNGALATSSPSFTKQLFGKKMVSHLVASDKRTPIIRPISVSVKALECWVADGLTKVVLNLRDQARHILDEYDAEAFIVA